VFSHTVNIAASYCPRRLCGCDSDSASLKNAVGGSKFPWEGARHSRQHRTHSHNTNCSPRRCMKNLIAPRSRVRWW